MENFPKNYDPKEREKYWAEVWKKEKTYEWDESESRENSFVVDTPPPTVSGKLHIGHVYSYTHTDFIVRFQRMKGKNVFYPIGFDDNGLPTERLVEKKKNIKAREVGRKEFVEICSAEVAEEEENFRKLLSSVGLSIDWNLEYRTISASSRKISQASFLDLVNKGEIYRNEQPILWDPVDQTALAQTDVEDKEKTSHMNYIKFTSEIGEELSVATTRPEMLPACVALFYAPGDARYAKLKGKYAFTPLFGIKVPISEDEAVDPEKGTGLVMCCTFGDQTDILWWKKHNLPLKPIVTKEGRIDFASVLPDSPLIKELSGLKIKEARDRVVEILKEKSLLSKREEITQTVKCAERSGAPLEIITAPQWFIHTLKHRKEMLKRSAELNWYPKYMKNRLDDWINSISWDWCISRQRYFGVPFPVWYSKRPGEEGKPVFARPEDLPVDPLTDLPGGYSEAELEPDRDVMDTWATSAVSPQLSSRSISKEFPMERERHEKLFPFDLRPQAHEIIRVWAFGTILKSHLHENKLPWKDIAVSGWCLAEDRSKMSKSKGNIIDPEKLIDTHGADVIRYWSSTSRLGSDTAYSEDVVKNGKRLVNKLWNAAKFVSGRFDILSPEEKKNPRLSLGKISHPFDKWFLSKLSSLVKAYEADMYNYEYSLASDKAEKFFFASFCDDYLEIVKSRAYDDGGGDPEGSYSAVLTLSVSVFVILKLLAPFLPYITEEIYRIIYDPSESIHLRNSFPTIDFSYENEEGDRLVRVLEGVRKFKAEKNLSVKAPISLLEIGFPEFSSPLVKDLAGVTSAESIKFSPKTLKEGEIIVKA